MHGVNKISLGEWAQPAKVYDLNNVGLKNTEPLWRYLMGDIDSM